jgi:hypothetical protein
MQGPAKIGIAFAAVLAIGAVTGQAAPPANAPGPKHCHYKQICVTKNRVCPPPAAKPAAPRPPCTPGPYQSCSQKRVCDDP